MSVPITERFNDSLGRFRNYDTYDPAVLALVDKQKHVNIRSFFTPTSYEVTLLELGTYIMTELDSFTMSELDALSEQGLSEGWTTGTIAENSSYGYYNTLTLTAGGATTLTTSSVLTTIDGAVAPIDILTGFADTDNIVIGFAGYTAADIDPAQSYVDFTSNSTGDFTAGPTASVSFTSGGLTSNAPDSFIAARSAFNQNGINLGSITGVRFRIKTTGATTVVILGGIRILDPNWQRLSLDVDTITDRLVVTPPTSGNYADSFVDSLPVLFRSDLPSGLNDPKPIDGEIGVMFYTGHVASAVNKVTLYFREQTTDFNAMVDLNGLEMGDLDGLPQPDTGTAAWNVRTQTELEIYDQSELDGDEQYDLERSPDSVSQSWIAFEFKWGTGGVSLKVLNSEGDIFADPTPGSVSNDQRHIMVAHLEGNTAWVEVYEVDVNGNIGTKIATTLDDTSGPYSDFDIKRRKGRYGWKAELNDPNSWISEISSRGMMFAEYRSKPLRSLTPVVGAQLFSTFTEPSNLFTGFGPGPFNTSSTTISQDISLSLSGESTKISNDPSAPLQGIQTNLFDIESYENLDINFDIYCSSDSPVFAFLMNEERTSYIPLTMPSIHPNHWNHVTLNPRNYSNDPYMQGYHTLALLFPNVQAETWWVDNMKIEKRAVVWDGRGVVDDPWLSNNALWTPFERMYNDPNKGILFTQRGKELQVRAKATNQDATISRIQVIPKYAELGRIKE